MSFFREKLKIEKPNKKIPWEKFTIGKVVEGAVKEVAPIGTLLEFPGVPDLTGFATTAQSAFGGEQGGKQGLSVGDKIKCYILDADKKKRILDVSLREELVSPSSTKPVELKEGLTVTATVELVQNHYTVLTLGPEHSLPSKNRIPVFMRSVGFNNVVYSNPFKKYSVFQKLQVVVKRLSGNSSGEADGVAAKFPALDRVVVTEAPVRS